MEKQLRCDWAKSEIEKDYHDHRWGVPLYDERELFKMLILEGQQSGLSWITILKKLPALCDAYDDFDPEKLIHYDDEKIEELMGNPEIIRNRLKIKAAIQNAHAYKKLCEEDGSLRDYLWAYVNHKPILNHWKRMEDVPAKTELSERISKDLKKKGFSFVGPTIIYAYMQAIGMVNDHLVDCAFRFQRKE